MRSTERSGRFTLFDWYFRDPEKPEVAEAMRRTVEFSDEIQLEDIAIREAVQKGLGSRTYSRGRSPSGARTVSTTSTV